MMVVMTTMEVTAVNGNARANGLTSKPKPLTAKLPLSQKQYPIISEREGKG